MLVVSLGSIDEVWAMDRLGIRSFLFLILYIINVVMLA